MALEAAGAQHGGLPLTEAFRQAAARRPTVFHTPGHKRGRWVVAPAGHASALLGWEWDGGDAVWAPAWEHRLSALVQQAGQAAARAWGAQRSWLLWNGATAGVLAAFLSVCTPGATVVLPRQSHRSALAALVLSGARPVYVASPVLEDWDLPLPPCSRDVPALSGAGPLFVVSPTYYGVLPDLPELVRQAWPQPVVVDEAHGSHLPFLDGLPHGLACGACLVVHGVHKTLAAPTQTGLLHLGTAPEASPRWPQAGRVAACLAMVQSTSPNPALLASLEQLAAAMQHQGRARCGQALAAAQEARERIEAAGPFRCLRPGDLPPPWLLDETRLVVDVTEAGMSGFEAQRRLMEDHGLWPEMADARRVVLVFTGADDAGTAQRAGEAFAALWREQAGRLAGAGAGSAAAAAAVAEAARRGRQLRARHRLLARLPPPGEAVLTPREAFLGRARWVPWERAPGEVAAEAVTPYPPGIAVVAPGERVTAEAARWVRAAREAGAEVQSWSGDGACGLWVVGPG